MGSTSSAVKRKYNQKAYDVIQTSVKKGDKDKIKEYAASKGMSLNGFINHLIEKEMKGEGDGLQETP